MAKQKQLVVTKIRLTPEQREKPKIKNDVFIPGPDNTQKLDPNNLRPMLQILQAGEMTVARATELLEMWLAGNYSTDQLPPLPKDNSLVTDDKFPMELVRELRSKIKALESASGAV